MKKTGKKIKINKSWKIGALAVVLAAWVSLPYLTAKAESESEVPLIVRTATLAAPSGSVNPHGQAEWQLYSSGNREIEVEIEDVNLAQGTSLTAFVNGNAIGPVVLDDRGRGRLKLRTEDGQAVPVVNDGSTVQVRNGTTVLVAGVFGGGGPTPTPSVSPSVTPTGTPTGTPSPSPSVSPSPSPTGSPSPSPSPTGTPDDDNELFATLSGPTLNGVLPSGFATSETHSSRTELEVRVRQVNLPIGTSLSVVVNGTVVGNITLQSGGEGRLRLRSDEGQFVPAITPGSTIAIRNAGVTVLTGTFTSSVAPTPSPSPTGTPGGTPTPTPSPNPSPAVGRSFEAHLTGAQVTPPVNTLANGEIKVVLNAAETQATAFGEFHNLSSNQTGARIETTGSAVTTVRDLGATGGRNGEFAPVTFNISAAQVQQLRSGLLSAVITSVNNPSGEIRGRLTLHSHVSDFNGDGINDLAVFRPSTGYWFTATSDGVSSQSLGGASDQVVSGDYDGDGKTDVAVYSDLGGQGVWQIKRSSDAGVTTAYFGLGSDMPVRGDFDGDGRLDITVFRPSDGVWYIQNSDNTGNRYVQFGVAGDKPMPADMDGDGRDDLVVYRPSQGDWHWLRSSDGRAAQFHWGVSVDIPVQGDFDGDGKGDLTIFRPSEGTWYTYRSSDGSVQIEQFGLAADIPVAGDYDGDGKADIALFRPSEGVWYIRRSSDLHYDYRRFGRRGDVPLAAR